jgi:signal transduction histidine kinase
MSMQINDVILDPARLDELVRLRLLDTPPEEPFDRLTRLASRLLGAPVAVVSLVDDHRQFFKSAVGLPQPWAALRETPLSHSFCQHVVTSAMPLIVDDAREHPLVRDNSAVKELNVIAYMGIPLTTPNGATLGSFCVIESHARKWTQGDQQTMTELAASVMSEIALRLAQDEMQVANGDLEREAARREHLLRALEVSSARLHAAQRLARVGSFVLHTGNARNGHWSSEACRIFAITEAEAPTTVASFVDSLVHPDDRLRVAAAITGTMRSSRSCRIEYRAYGPYGELSTMLTTVEPETHGDDVLAALLTVLDVTDRIRAEAKLAEYRSELWHVSRVATAGEMATVIAHEINQPLAAIAHTANACRRLISNGNIGYDEIVEHLSGISAQAMRASKIIAQIRNYVRKQPAAPRALSLDDVVDDILNLLSMLTQMRGITIERVRGRNLPLVMGDEIQLGQLALNLVRNATDAVAETSGRDRKIIITTSSSDRGHTILEVADNGCGVPADLIEQIFEPFFSTRSNGLGMGLPIAKTIAEAHDAVLSVNNRCAQEGGACFRVVFPASR